MPCVDFPPVKIKLATATDAEEIALIHKSCILQTNSKVYPAEVINKWVSSISQKNIVKQLKTSTWILAGADKSLVGFGQFSVADGVIYQIQVLPEFQGRGIGRKLYSYIQGEFLRNGRMIISLNSTINAVPFYEKMGFKKISSFDFELDRGVGVKMWRMKKGLEKDGS